MSIARKSAAEAASQIGIMAVSLAAGIFVSRYLGGEGRGEFFLATVLASGLLKSFTNFGMQLSGQVHVAKDPNRLSELHTLAVLFALLVGGVAAAVILSWPGLFQRRILQGISSHNLAIVSFLMPVILYHDAWRGLMIGLGRIERRAVFEFLYAIVQNGAIITILLAVSGKPVQLLIYSYYAVYAAGAVAMAVLIRTEGAAWRIPSPALIRQILGYGKWVYAGNLAAELRPLLDQLLVNAAGDRFLLGVYNQAASLANRTQTLAQSLSVGAYREITAAEKGEAGRLVAAAFRQMIVIGVVVFVAGSLASPLIPLIYGGDFARSVGPFRLLLAGVCVLGGARILAVYFSGYLVRPQIPMVINWITVAVQLTACLLLARLLGPIWGIACGTVLAYSVTTFLFLVLFLRREETPGAGDLLAVRREDLQRWLDLLGRALRTGRKADGGARNGKR